MPAKRVVHVSDFSRKFGACILGRAKPFGAKLPIFISGATSIQPISKVSQRKKKHGLSRVLHPTLGLYFPRARNDWMFL